MDDTFFTTDLTGTIWRVDMTTLRVHVSYTDGETWHDSFYSHEDIEHFLALDPSDLDHMRVVPRPTV